MLGLPPTDKQRKHVVVEKTAVRRSFSCVLVGLDGKVTQSEKKTHTSADSDILLLQHHASRSFAALGGGQRCHLLGR